MFFSAKKEIRIDIIIALKKKRKLICFYNIDISENIVQCVMN